VIGNDQPIPPGHRYFNASLPQRKFDLDKAKFHLQKAGAVGTTFAADLRHYRRERFGRNGAVDAADGGEDRREPDRESRSRGRLLVETTG